MIRRSETKKGRPPSTDLLVCFPSRTHLTIMPKPICSPARPTAEPNNRYHHNNRHVRKLSARSGGGGGGVGGSGGHASPHLWSKNKHMGGSENSEPSSPKVTCAGQIKVKPKTSSCKNWRSVMEEIERIHNNNNTENKEKKSSFGFRKEVMQVLTSLRRVHFDFSCFGAFPQTDITTDGDEDDDDDDDGDDNDNGETEETEEDDHGGHGGNGDTKTSSRSVFSNWYMVLPEENHDIKEKKQEISCDDGNDLVCGPSSDDAPPPPNALLLMRCRSAPAKAWREEEEEEEEIKKNGGDREEDRIRRSDLRSLMAEEKRNRKDNLVVMKYDTDFYKISSDVAKETWVVGGMDEFLSRSRSWKR